MGKADNTYGFAFTGASMKLHDFIRLAQYVADHDMDIMLEAPDPNVIMRRGKNRTNRRQFQEMIKRLRLLSPLQRETIPRLEAIGQRQIAFLAICKAYPVIREFVMETVREKYLVLDYFLTDADFQTFINRKAELYPELEEFSDSTLKKGRQVLWRMLEQGGIINDTKERRILPQFVIPEVLKAIQDENPQLLGIFLMPEHAIQALKE